MADYAAAHLGLADVLSVADGRRRRGVPGVHRAPAAVSLHRRGGVRVGAARRVGRVGRRRLGLPVPAPAHHRAGDPPRKFAAGEERPACRCPPWDRAARAGWRRLRSASVGEFDVQMLLALNARARPARAAAGWGGGRFELWRRPAPGCDAPLRAGRSGLAAAALGHPDRPRRGRGRAADGGREGGEAAEARSAPSGPVCGRPWRGPGCAHGSPPRWPAGGHRPGNRYRIADRVALSLRGACGEVAPRGGAPSGKSGQAAPGGRIPLAPRHPGRGGRGKKALVRRAYSAYPGRRACMCRSSSVRPTPAGAGPT